MISRNRERLLDDIASAALKAGRNPMEVSLLAVTKGVGMAEIEALARSGHREMGENRAEQLVQRKQEADERGLDLRWHMIGHLQRRKVRDLLPHVALVHSVDSLRLAEEIEKRASGGDGNSNEEEDEPGASGRVVPVLLEVNVSGEVQKQGVFPDELEEVVRQISALEHLELQGLMTMAPLVDEAERVRPVFRRLRELRDELNEKQAYRMPLRELSMGMSQDYRVAVEEGATIVRVGTSLFEQGD